MSTYHYFDFVCGFFQSNIKVSWSLFEWLHSAVEVSNPSFSWSNVTEVNFASQDSSHFRAMEIFSYNASLIVTNANDSFASTWLVNAFIRPQNLLQFQRNMSIETFLRNANSEFFYIISLLNNVVHQNQFISSQRTNVTFFIHLDFIPIFGCENCWFFSTIRWILLKQREQFIRVPGNLIELIRLFTTFFPTETFISRVAWSIQHCNRHWSAG